MVIAQIATISDDIEDHTDENTIEEICCSIEDLYHYNENRKPQESIQK